MQEADPNLRQFMSRHGLNESQMADQAGVSQATVSRALRHRPKRAGRAWLRLFSYIHNELRREGLAHADKTEVLRAFERVWGASEAHAVAIAKVVGALDSLRPPDKEAG